MNCFKYLLATLSLVANISSFSSQEPGISAKDAVFKALQNNFDVQIIDKQEEIAEKNNHGVIFKKLSTNDTVLITLSTKETNPESFNFLFKTKK